MLHWTHKLPAVVLLALTVAAALGRFEVYGFFW
jgi:hypothetical protein